MYTLTYLYLIEFFRSVSLAAMRGRDSPEKKVRKVSFLSLVTSGGLDLRHVLFEAKFREKKNQYVFIYKTGVKQAQSIFSLGNQGKSSWRSQLFY